MKTKITYILCAINALVFHGCDIVNPPEDIPAYIHVEKFTFTTDEVKEGTAANKITDAWIYAGNSFMGGYEMPATIPTLEKGSKQVTVYAGVLENGISITRVPYPFFKPYVVDVELEETKTDTIKPAWRYKEEARFPWIESFEGSTISLELSTRSTSDFRITTSPDSAFEGNSAIAANVDPSHVVFECQTKNTFQLPRGGRPVWLEIHYKTEVPVEIGLYSMGPLGDSKLFAAGMNPSASWNKIYINITPTVSLQPQIQLFKVYIAAFNKDAGGKILIDNLKLLYLE